MKRTTIGLLAPLMLFAPVAAGQHASSPSPSIEALQLPTFVTQLGKTHFPFKRASHYDSAEAVGTLPSGAVVIAGRTYSSLGEPHAGPNMAPDIFLARFDLVGSLEWIRHFGSSSAESIPRVNGDAHGPGGDATGWDLASDLAVGADGSIYVTGYTQSDLAETNIDNGSMFLAKFDADGALQWLRQIGEETKAVFVQPWGTKLHEYGDSWGHSMLIDPSGDVYVAGTTSSDLAEYNGTWDGFPSDVFLARFSADGRLQWLRQMGAVSSGIVGFDSIGEEYNPQIALHPSGAIVMTASSELWDFLPGWVIQVDSYVTLFSFDGEGTPLAAVPLPGTNSEGVSALAIDPTSGRIFVAGQSYGGGNSGTFVASFDKDLRLEWFAPDTPSLGIVGGLCVDAAGDLILAGSTTASLGEPNGGGADVLTAKLRGSDGELVWTSQIGKTTSALHGLDPKGSDYPFDISLGPRDTMVLAGSTGGNLAESNAGNSDVFVMRLNPDGSL